VAELGSDDVIFELDAKVVVNNFNNPSRNLSYFGFIMTDWIFNFKQLLEDKLKLLRI
jgi:hypothetical protein